MNQTATLCNVQLAPHDLSVRTRQHRRGQYQRVFDERKRPIRGLWIRNGRYYAQLTLEDHDTGAKGVRRIPLAGASTPAQARKQLEDLRVGRRKGALPLLKQTPKFSAFATEYLAFFAQAKDRKKASTMETEKHAIKQWKAHLGERRLDKIHPIHIQNFIARRQKEGKAARTVNLEVTILRNVLNMAIDHKWILSLPTENLRPLKGKRRKRDLVTTEQIDRLCAVGSEPLFFQKRLAKDDETGHPLVNAQQFSDYIRFMTYCGARMAEALRVRWRDVDWKQRQLHIGTDGDTKNHEYRTVDFNAKLEHHLKKMFARRVPDSEWLFPSPRRGEKDAPAKTFRESMILARMASGLSKFGFHDCRHHFVSMCVMSGIDYMTIAKWVGHKDSGILIGRIYGHLSNEHAKRQAEKINFEQ